MRVLDQLEPKRVFSFFEDLCAIPHGSGNTKAVKKAKVCATLKKKMAYCSEKWTHIKLARQYMREYEYMQP